MHSCTWRICDNYIRLAMKQKKLIITYFNYIPGKKQCMVYIINECILSCIIYCFFCSIYSNNFFCAFTQKNTDASCSAIEVINNFFTC